MNKRNHFPLFLACDGRLAVVVGGGKIAERRIKSFLKFNLKVRTISPTITHNLKKLVDSGEVEHIARNYIFGDLEGVFIATTCTDNREVNSEVAREAKSKNIPISVCDSATLSSFWFPAIDVNEDIIMGAVGNGKDHKFIRLMAEELRKTIKKVREIYHKNGDRFDKL